MQGCHCQAKALYLLIRKRRWKPFSVVLEYRNGCVPLWNHSIALTTKACLEFQGLMETRCAKSVQCHLYEVFCLNTFGPPLWRCTPGSHRQSIRSLQAHYGHARPSLPTQEPSDAQDQCGAIRISCLRARHYPNRQSLSNRCGRLLKFRAEIPKLISITEELVKNPDSWNHP